MHYCNAKLKKNVRWIKFKRIIFNGKWVFVLGKFF